MLEDPTRHWRVGEDGDAAAAAAARGAAQHVDREGPLQEFGPAAALCLGAGVGFGLGLADAWRGTGPGGGPGAVGDGAAGDDGIAQGRGGGEDAEVGPLVLARVGDQGDEALEEGEGVEDEGPRAVAPGAAEGPLDPAVPADLEPTLGEGWAGDVANEALEAISVVGLDAGGGVEREACLFAPELVRVGGARVGGAGGAEAGRGIDQARDRAARVEAQGDLRLERGGLDEGEQRIGVLGRGC